ncbi:oxysterol-binding protein-related protein 3/6/7 [Microdochium nivale]|nr:oxysterol-binding protein-related protein 3/6/7 [Microdochium nivale]
MSASVACLRQLVFKSGRAPLLRAHAATWQECWPTTQYRFLHNGSPAQTTPRRPVSAPPKAENARSDEISTRHSSSVTQFGDETATGQTFRSHRPWKNVDRWEDRERVKVHARRRPPPRVLVRPAQEYPSKAETRRSEWKHINSVRRQSRLGLKKLESGEVRQLWQDTFELLAQNTPKSDGLLKFRVTIGKGAATEARTQLIEGLDTNVWRISRRHQSEITVDEGDDNGSLDLKLSGSENAVRLSLLEVLRAVGELTALRVDNVKLRAALARDWENGDETTSRVRLLNIGEIATGDAILTLREETNTSEPQEPQPITAFDNPYNIPDGTYVMPTTKHKQYKLHQRADNIPPPSVWTKRSLEDYVAALTYGEVPPHKVQELYGNGPSHQDVVTSLLVRALTSKETRAAISLSALNLALVHMQKLGPGFRPASERILAQIERQDLPADSETYTILLVGASRGGDLDSYTAVLKTMIRKGFKPQARAWFAFLEMTQMRTKKLSVLGAMRRKGLGLVTSVKNEMARHGVLLELESQIDEAINARAIKAAECEADCVQKTPFQTQGFQMTKFLESQCEEHGTGWLDVTTVNRMLELLGRGQENDAFKQLLTVAKAKYRIDLDVVTLNTMLTHVRNIPVWLSVMEKMFQEDPWLQGDRVTFEILFSMAWATNKPNMMAVIWRYATMARRAPSKMQNWLNSLLVREESHLGTARLRNRIEWLPIIFGQADLDEATAVAAEAGKKNVTFYDISANFETARGKRSPAVRLPQKLREAFEKDILLYKLKRATGNGEVSEESMRALTVEIPLKKPVVQMVGLL